MPKLNDHGLGGGGKALGVPLYPLNNVVGILEDDNLAFDCFYGNETTTSPIEISGNASCNIDDDIYFFGSSTDNSAVYKYNVKSKIWTKLSNSPNSDVKNWAVPNGTTIYYSGDTSIYKYDTVTDKHTSVSSPRTFTSSSATLVNDSIYIFGGDSTSGNARIAQNYNINTNLLTDLTGIPISMSKGHRCIDGGDGYIYLFGGNGDVTGAYRYSINNNSYEKLSKNPIRYSEGAIARDGDYIFLISSSFTVTSGSETTSYAQKMCIFDITTLTFTESIDFSTARYNGHAAVIDGVLYVIGGGDSSTTYKSGDSLKVLKGVSGNISIQQLVKGVKVYTDGEIYSGIIKEFDNMILFSSDAHCDKLNGVVKIPTDGLYALLDSNYATIGG